VRRRFSIGQILVAVVVVVLAVVAISALTRSTHPTDDSGGANFMPCPSGAPAACSDRVAQVWKNEARRLPTIAIPDGLRYDRGFIATTGEPAVFFVFQTFVEGSQQPTELTLRVSPATSKPYDAAHRGGKSRHLPSGRAYLDFSNDKRSGPFVERIGQVEVVVSLIASAAPESLKTTQLSLLDGVTAE
jgi:hypothetical protein